MACEYLAGAYQKAPHQRIMTIFVHRNKDIVMYRHSIGAPAASIPFVHPLAESAEAGASEVLASAQAASAGASILPKVATSAASPATVPERDDVLQLLYTHHSYPILPKDLWGEVAKFSSRGDVLSLRTASTDMSRWVDRSVTSLKVDANKVAGTLAVVGNAIDLNHITTLRIEHCTNRNLRAVIAALSVLPHAAIDIELVRDRYTWDAFDANSLVDLRDLLPRSLRLSEIGTLTPRMAQLLGQLSYPLHLSGGQSHGRVEEDALRALAGIPHLASLEVTLDAVSDDVALALGAHPELTTLHLNTSWAIKISHSALISLASSSTLKTMCLDDTRDEASKEVIAAFAANGTLESLMLKGFGQYLDEAFAVTMSTNTTLKTLNVPLAAGCGHLAKIRSLEHLVISGEISLRDAEIFSANAHLKSVNCYRTRFEAGALAVMAKSTIEHFTVYAPIAEEGFALEDKDIDAFLSNETLRKLECLFLPFDAANGVGHAIRLAEHPTLASLNLFCDRPGLLFEEAAAISLFTEVDRAALLAAWGPHRPADALKVNY